MSDRQALTQQILTMTPEELDLFIFLAEKELGLQLPGAHAPDRLTSD